VSVAVVWFKRDLRIDDHAPLTEAARGGPIVALYVHEPAIWALPEYDPAHVRFVDESLDALDAALREVGGRLTRRVGDAVEVLEAIARAVEPVGGLRGLFSHQETGLAATWARDRAVARWCRARQIPWIEHDQDGVCRPHPDRDGWAARWRARMVRPPLPAPERISDVASVVPAWRHDVERPPLPVTGLAVQPGGSPAARATLRAFFADRADGYPARTASPLTGPSTSSRLSPHLAWGTLSVRTALRHAHLHAERLGGRRDPAADARRRGLRAFEERLAWRGHFMQRLEDLPALEHEDLHPAAPRERLDPELHAAWAEGRTGWPMVDACMRALAHERWLPFRMRALLVSTHSYLLWQPWKPAASHLARYFLDFEPGIHYAQVQMQSGTTGISELRIYDPEKQARDHDPKGAFLRRWLPELAGVPDAFVHAPQTMDEATQRAAGCRIGRDYPAPLVDAGRAAAAARRRIEAARATPEARARAFAVHDRVGSRRPARDRSWR
jgi:deoxyribodipyrimidine photo-lyase